jgi:CheY-like chemotaxis protein
MSICLNDNALTSQNTKKRILVVNNEKDITTTLQVGLEDGGFDVDTFTDPLLAMKSFKPNYYDLVLIDIVMPVIDGFELHERLNKIDPNFKVCFLTASEMYHTGRIKDVLNSLSSSMSTNNQKLLKYYRLNPQYVIDKNH